MGVRGDQADSVGSRLASATVEQVRNGGRSMSGLEGRLSEAEIEMAEFVAANADQGGGEGGDRPRGGP